MGKRLYACASALLLAAPGCVSRVEVPTDPASLDALRPRERAWVLPEKGPVYSGAFFRVERDSLILLGGDKSHIGTRLLPALFVPVLILLAGCTVTRPLPREAPAIAGLRPGTRLLVHPDSGRAFRMRFEEIRNDTLFGTAPERNVRMPRARIDSLCEVRTSRRRTKGLISGTAGAAAAAITVYAIYGYLHPGY